MKSVSKKMMTMPYNIFYKGKLIRSYTPFVYDEKDEEYLVNVYGGNIIQDNKPSNEDKGKDKDKVEGKPVK